MISICAPIYDPSGVILLSDARIFNSYEGRRRGTVTATLDGGVAVYDAGYSVADQTLKASIENPTKALLETFRYLVAYYSQVIVSCEVGVFDCVLGYSLRSATLSIEMRITNRLDQ